MPNSQDMTAVGPGVSVPVFFVWLRGEYILLFPDALYITPTFHHALSQHAPDPKIALKQRE